MAEAGKDHIFEIIDRVFLVLNLSCSQSHGDVVQRLVDQEANVKFKSNGKQVGDLRSEKDVSLHSNLWG